MANKSTGNLDRAAELERKATALRELDARLDTVTKRSRDAAALELELEKAIALRNLAIVEATQAGATRRDVASYAEMTPGRVQQILEKLRRGESAG